MSGDFNVFDEWGNYVGKFTPAGGGYDNLIVTLFLFALLITGFLFYLLVKLAIRGIKELNNGNVKKGLLYLAIPILLVCNWFYQFAIAPALVANARSNLCESIRVKAYASEGSTLIISSGPYGGTFTAEMVFDGVREDVMINFGMEGATHRPAHHVGLLNVSGFKDGSSPLGSNMFYHDCGGRVLYP